MASQLMYPQTRPSPQLLSVGEKDKKRLLEVYVKRSLSLNDGSQSPWRKEHRSRKWVPIPEHNPRTRRHSSDTSLNLTSQLSVSDPDVRFENIQLTPVIKKEVREKEECSEKKSKKSKGKVGLFRNDGSNASQKSNGKPKKRFPRLEKEKEESGQSSDALPTQNISGNSGDNNTHQLNTTEASSGERKEKKAKKPTVWKSFLSWFSKGNSEKEQEHQRPEKEPPPSTPTPISCLPLVDSKSNSGVSARRSKSMKKKLSHKKSLKWMQSRETSSGKSVEMVEPTSSYYEKMSEELEKIVHEVKDSPVEDKTTLNQNSPEVSQEEVVRMIIELIKQEGDIIDYKLKENPALCSFLEGFSYGFFQQMADHYVQSEVPNKKSHSPVAAPELVKFAFTLDFTARVANLHRQATGQIMGFGNQYLQDRFTHMSESHPHLADERRTLNSEEEFNSL